MLLALTTQVLATEILLKRGRFHAEIFHPGKPQIVEIQLRSKDEPSEPWHYHDDFKTYPRKVRTSEDGRRILVVMPKTAGKYVQLCSVLKPTKHSSSEPLSAAVSLKTCANVFALRE